MSTPDWQHIRMDRVGDVVVIELVNKDLQGPAIAQELGNELNLVLAQDWAKQLLVDFKRVRYLSSTGFAVLFKLVSQFKQSGGQLKMCGMDPAIRLGADISGLTKFVSIYENEAAALETFQPVG